MKNLFSSWKQDLPASIVVFLVALPLCRKIFEAKFIEIRVKQSTKCKINILQFHDFSTNAFKIFREGNKIYNKHAPKILTINWA
jgi:hypothetical protein